MESENYRPNTGGDLAVLVQALADAVSQRVIAEMTNISAAPTIQPALLDVKQAAIYLGRTEQSVQHLIFDKALPVVRHGRRVHLHRRDLDAWIEENKF